MQYTVLPRPRCRFLPGRSLPQLHGLYSLIDITVFLTGIGRKPIPISTKFASHLSACSDSSFVLQSNHPPHRGQPGRLPQTQTGQHASHPPDSCCQRNGRECITAAWLYADAHVLWFVDCRGNDTGSNGHGPHLCPLLDLSVDTLHHGLIGAVLLLKILINCFERMSWKGVLQWC